jgi:chitin synthase
LGAFVAALPVQTPSSFYTSLDIIRAFTHTVTPFNPSLPRYSSLAAQFTLSQEGELLATSLSLSTSGIDTHNGLLSLSHETGFRAFDVFYYLNVSSASKAEREVLNLKPSSSYSFLKRSGTFQPPSYLPTADDAAAAEDFRHNLRSIGIKGSALQNLIAALAGILKLGDSLDYLADQDTIYNVCEDAGALLDMDPMILRVKCTQEDRKIFIAGLYEAIVDWVIRNANDAMKAELKVARSMANGGSRSTSPEGIHEDTVAINIIDIPSDELGKAVALRTVFDDSQGINLEMREDGYNIVSAGASVLNEMRNAVAACGTDLGDMDSVAGRDRDMERDRRQGLLEMVAQHADADSFMKDLLHPVAGQGVVLGTYGQGGRFELSHVLGSSRVWFQLNIHPADDAPASFSSPVSHWSAAAVSSQLRAWRLPEWANRRNRQLDFTADFDPDEFVERYASLGCQPGVEGIKAWLLERGWTNGEVHVGNARVWLRETAWWEAECMKDQVPVQSIDPTPMDVGMDHGFFGDPTSRDNLIPPQGSPSIGASKAGSIAPGSRNISAGDYGLGTKGDQYKGEVTYEGHNDLENADGRVLEQQNITFSRRIWVFFVWLLTFWIPSPFLRYIGRMKRPDVRLAWREKVTLCFIILLINGIVIFYIIFFGKLLCPNFDKAWNTKEVGFHGGTDDYWVSHRGKVYDLTKWYKIQHSDVVSSPTSQSVMIPFAGTDVSEMISPPLSVACPNLITDKTITLTANTTIPATAFIHTSGPNAVDPTSALSKSDWYITHFLKTMQPFYKGDLVWDPKYISSQGQAGYHNWIIIDKSIYDFTDYFYTINTVAKGDPRYQFLPTWFTDIVQKNNGADVTATFQSAGLQNETSLESVRQCLDDYFYIGKTDFRLTPRCQVQNYLLLAFTIILCTVIGIKFLSALQLGSKRRPTQQDKFVICQVPAYTEGEDQLRKGLDSLTGLAYDNKRKLICVICDGVIVGAGNDRPTPKIVLDILGVDPKTDPPALPFKAVGQGSEQLNYGKVYSGLYEFEGNVVPYLVIVKVGKESEQNKPKPGNRGKRDSQIMLMSFLNRVHHRAPMSPLELEMFHQINNVIGVDPELYEYLLMVDADTMVVEDSLNRLVAACANDEKIAGICGETSLQNEERSWWTMIQVYEYYISHHLAKAFESLFGSVTCLPGW